MEREQIYFSNYGRQDHCHHLLGHCRDSWRKIPTTRISRILARRRWNQYRRALRALDRNRIGRLLHRVHAHASPLHGHQVALGNLEQVSVCL